MRIPRVKLFTSFAPMHDKALFYQQTYFLKMSGRNSCRLRQLMESFSFILLSRFNRNGLRNEIFFCTGLAVIIRPAVYHRKFFSPVAMNVSNRRCPFKCIGSPWIFSSAVTTEDAVEKVKEENKLCQGSKDRKPRAQLFNINKVLKKRESRISVIPARHTC